MTIIVHFNELEETVGRMLSHNEFESISIDYMFNAVMGWKNGEEIPIHDFTPYLRLDNRFNSYNLEVINDKIEIDFFKP